MNKIEIVKLLIEQLSKELLNYERIAEQARQDAIDGEMKQEGKYDTRAIEASYLAGAQKRRLDEIRIEIQNLENLDLKPLKTNKTALGSLVLLSDDNWYFVAPVAGGLQVKHNSSDITVLSVQSPMARQLIGLEEGDEFKLVTPKGTRELSLEKLL